MAEQHSGSSSPSTGTHSATLQGTKLDAEHGETALICVMERPTGSNIAERVCRRATEGEIQRMRTQDSLAVPKASPPVKTPTGGN
jgi:hypothetical protein